MIIDDFRELFKEIVLKKTTPKNKESLSFLLKKNKLIPNQSENIKIGIILEKLLTLYIEKKTNYKSIKPPNKKGKREKDILLKHMSKKIIVYAETKANLNLDSEKHKSTYKKILKNEFELKDEFKDYKIKVFLVGLRYLINNDIEPNIKAKYKVIEDKLVGINEFLNYVGAVGFKDFDEYEKLLVKLYNHYFPKNNK